MKLYESLKRIAEVEFADIVDFALILPFKLRIFLKDESFIDVWFSQKITDRYSYHWERIDSIFRHDNIPHLNWKEIKSFPKHFHNGSQENVEESYLSDDPYQATREFLDFVRNKIH